MGNNEKLHELIKHYGALSEEMIKTVASISDMLMEESDGNISAIGPCSDTIPDLHIHVYGDELFGQAMHLLGHPEITDYTKSDEYLHLHYYVDNVKCVTLITHDSAHLIKKEDDE